MTTPESADPGVGAETRILPNDYVPIELIEAARRIGDWFAERNIKDWALGPCAARFRASPSPPEDASVAALVRRFACFTMEDGVYEHPRGEHVAYADYAKLAAANAALRAELAARDADRADAERYRWLCANAVGAGCMQMNGYQMLLVCDVCKGLIDEEIPECSTCTCQDDDDDSWPDES